MRILDRYIGRTVIGAIFVVEVVLVLVFSFFALIDQLDDVGRGNYGVMQMLAYVALSAPGLAYELLPMAALIGALIGLGTLVGNGELTVVRAAGVPLWRVIAAVVKAGFVVMIAALIIGELVAPPSEQAARNQRSIALAAQVALKTRNGFWARDGSSYINIRTVLPGDRVQDIYIYEFDRENRLQVASYARRALYADGQWLLEGLRQTDFRRAKVKRRLVPRAAWESLLNPDLISMVVINPNSLSMYDLVNYIGYLNENGQDARRYQQALWIKLIYPLATVVMVFLAVPMVFGSPRTGNIGQRVLIGAVIGLVFHVFNQGAANLGLVLDMNPALSVTLPTLAALVIAVLLMRRVH
ncbi:MAG: LPS export ABC transporter permease LptG [Gammaproteobacteria bacterium]|nr:LPS export ABC transporter permease LptG [Gammaproteobacteria bacterium]